MPPAVGPTLAGGPSLVAVGGGRGNRMAPSISIGGAAAPVAPDLWTVHHGADRAFCRARRAGCDRVVLPAGDGNQAALRHYAGTA